MQAKCFLDSKRLSRVVRICLHNKSTSNKQKKNAARYQKALMKQMSHKTTWFDAYKRTQKRHNSCHANHAKSKSHKNFSRKKQYFCLLKWLINEDFIRHTTHDTVKYRIIFDIDKRRDYKLTRIWHSPAHTHTSTHLPPQINTEHVFLVILFWS